MKTPPRAVAIILSATLVPGCASTLTLKDVPVGGREVMVTSGEHGAKVKGELLYVEKDRLWLRTEQGVSEFTGKRHITEHPRAIRNRPQRDKDDATKRHRFDGIPMSRARISFRFTCRVQECGSHGWNRNPECLGVASRHTTEFAGVLASGWSCIRHP